MNANTISVNEYSKRPNGQPEGYDFYIPFDLEESRLLEKEEYIKRMDVITLAKIVIGQGYNANIFNTYYERLLEREKIYDDHKAKISETIVMPFIDSIYGENSNVAVRWTHSFKTPYIAVRYMHNIPDHSVEKDMLHGTFTAEEIGIDDATVDKLSRMAVVTIANEDIFDYIMRNYPDPDEAQLSRIDEFIDKKNRELSEYEDFKASITPNINAFLGSHGIDVTKQSLQWNMNFESKTIAITNTSVNA